MDRAISSSQIKQNKFRQFGKWCAGLVVLFAMGVGFYWYIQPSIDRSDIRTAKVSQQTIKASISASGTVVPVNSESIISPISSYVREVLVYNGQSVEKGDVLMHLDTENIGLEINNIEEKIALKDTLIERAELNLKKAANALRSQLELLQIDLMSRRSKQQKLAELNKLGAFSKQDLVEAGFNVQRTEIEIKQRNQSIADLQASTKAEIATIRLEKSLLQKELAEKIKLQERATLKATRSGIVTFVLEQEGKQVSQGETLVQLADNSAYQVQATLSDFYSSQIPNVNFAEVRYKNEVISGHLLKGTPRIEDGVMLLQVILENPKHALLKPNLRVEVDLVTSVIESTLSIAKGPYVNGRGLQEVFLVKDNMAYRTQIELGASDAQRYQIKHGLAENDEIIISDMSSYMHHKQISIR